jgi:Ring finger domain/IQ calmodulin-binding motif
MRSLIIAFYDSCQALHISFDVPRIGRNDAYCPICMEGFKDGREVLLSCSHLFHRHCLSSFEIFMKSEESSCPVCRASQYQKKITRLGSKAYEVVCSLKIQRMFRGYMARKEYHEHIKFYYDSGRGGKSRQKTRFYEKQLSSYLRHIDDDFHRNKVESDFIIRYK